MRTRCLLILHIRHLVFFHPMNHNFHFFRLLFIFLALSISTNAQSVKYISLKQRSEVLENSKKTTNEVDLYFDNTRQTITKYYHSAFEFIMVINSLGEIKTYYPSSNEVAFKQIGELSSKRNLIYYFANNITDQLGLAEEGFKLISNTYENQYYVTTWAAPAFLKGIESVRMVFDNGVPIYSEYQANKKKITRKIYYTDYKDFNQFRLPLKIIEISYKTSGDSIINRTVFSDIRVSSTADSKYFNFKIPDNAKPVESVKGK
jgi:hypothetical protein